MEILTLDEAIKHAKEVAKTNRAEATYNFPNLKEYYDNCLERANQHNQLAEWLKELKSYKEAEEQGLLVRLPCPIGTTVWDICGIDIRENVLSGIEFGKDGKQFLWANHDEFLGELNDLVFLTREEAEKKLEEMENGL